MEYNFKDFLLESEEKDNVMKTIAKLPELHRKLLNGYKFKFQSGNTLKGDKESVGMIFQDKIIVAAPWVYSREFIVLHEIAHLFFEKLMTKELRKKWSELVRKTKNGQKSDIEKKDKSTDTLNQDDEEVFAMAYGATYAKNPPLVWYNEKWVDFIKNKIPN